MSKDPPPPYPRGPSAPPYDETDEQAGTVPITTPQQQHPLPPEYAPPAYEPPLPGQFPQYGHGGRPVPVTPAPQGGPYVTPQHQFSQPTPRQTGAGASHIVHVVTPPGRTTTVTVLQRNMFNELPVQLVCPHCHEPIFTRISYEIGITNTVFCLICIFIGCDLGCCLIPCLINDLKDVRHTCPNCNGYIYTYKRSC